MWLIHVQCDQDTKNVIKVWLMWHGTKNMIKVWIM